MLKSKEYWQGFLAGQKEERKKSVELLRIYIESLKDVQGIGPKTYQKIVQHINTVNIKNYLRKD